MYRVREEIQCLEDRCVNSEGFCTGQGISKDDLHLDTGRIVSIQADGNL
jgi:hypothetical protein